MRSVLALLAIVFVLFISAHSEAAGNCSLNHPQGVVWKAPAQFVWKGACFNGQAHGYGWYEFNLSNDGFPAAKVELLIEYANGAVSNDFYYFKMYNQDKVTHEGYALLGESQIDAGTCLSLADCARTMEVLKNGVQPPLPPMAPAVPPMPAPPSVDQQRQGVSLPASPRYTTAAAAYIEFVTSVSAVTDELVKRAYQSFGEESEYIDKEVRDGMSYFTRYFPLYASSICRRNKKDLERCQIHQYEVIVASMSAIVSGKPVEEILPATRSYRSRSELCENTGSMADARECWSNQLTKLENSLKRVHPSAVDAGVTAFAGYAGALSYLNAAGGSAYGFEFLGNYEKLLEFINTQAQTTWVD
ncbi:hypothetical protein [Bdellovibrio bacteriovorus]|uniref:hypothetical protein n=1 Tax=Bdellovibrio bacteriovorus TaxID=959 RepID=UPI003AA8ED43